MKKVIKEIIPVEKYVEKALIDEIFSSTVGRHSISRQEIPRNFKILQKNLIDTITIKKEEKEEEKNKNKNRIINFKFLTKKNSYNDILNLNNARINSFKTLTKRGLTKRSMTSKYTNIFKIQKSNREVLSSFGFRIMNKDFSDITSNINYLLVRNQNLLLKEKTFIDGFDFSRKNKLNNEIFKKKDNLPRSGLFGKKEEIPLIYDHSFVYKNEYPSKSVKTRHEYLLNELNKLKFYLEQNPQDKLYLIKDFFLKLNIKDFSTYSDEKLFEICNIITSLEQNDLSKIIKPGINLKQMVYDLFDIPKNKTQNNFFTKINFNSMRYTPSNLIRNRYQKSRNSAINKRNTFDINKTNSKLKYIENQKGIYKSEKNYSQNNELIINDIGKEIRMLKEKISLNKNKNDDRNLFFITQGKSKTIPHSELNKKNKTFSFLNIKKYSPKKTGTYLFFRKSLTKKIKNENENELKYKKINFCLKSKKKIFEVDNNNKLINEKIKKKKYSNNDIIQRLYYKPNFNILGFNEIKRSKKLTEFIALNLAKKKERIKDIVNELNPVHINKTYDFL